MKSLRNVGEIRYVFDTRSSGDELENIAENMGGYSFQETLENLEDLKESIKDNKNLEKNTDWEVKFKDTSKYGNITGLVRKGQYLPTVYAFVWDKNNSPESEIGLGFEIPKKGWVEQLEKNSEESESKSSSSPTDKDHFRMREKKRERKREKKREKKRTGYTKKEHKKRYEKKGSKSESDDNSKTKKDKKENKRVNSKISKENLRILLEARLANVLHPGGMNQDYNNIIKGYPNLDNVLRSIYDEKSLIENRERLPYEFTDEEIEEITRTSEIQQRKDESSLSKDKQFDLERILE